MPLDSDNYALLFPGQGNQFTGMGWGWHRDSERARALFERAERVSGIPVRRLCFEGSRAELGATEVTQPCVLVVGLAAIAALEDELEAAGRSLEPRFVAGHSLGQFTALVAAGALGFDQALELVCTRARLMAAAGGGGMAAVIGLAPDRVGTLCAEVAGEAVVVAALNGPEQTVVSGERGALSAVCEAAEGAGAARVIALPISIAAHSPAMAPAQAQFAAAVDALELVAPRAPIVLNGDPRPTRSAAVIRAELRGHMCATVRWWPAVQAMLGAGVELLVEVGPGRSLARELAPALAPASVACLGRRPVPTGSRAGG